jgi:orotidine-5'-phosphate decarboxylase
MAISDTLEFNRHIIDATHDFVCAFKPQLAFYEAMGAEGFETLKATVAHIRAVAPDVVIIGDGKRGDIGSTASAYAKAMFDYFDFDTVTLNPYLGRDSIAPFLEYGGRGAIIVCRTSNPGATELQDYVLEGTDGKTVYQRVADATEEWDDQGRLGIVIGATYPGEMAVLRAAHPGLPILIPGVGAQGGDVEAATRAGVNADGRGVMISSSRGIIYASESADEFESAARGAASALRDEINRSLPAASGQ